MNVLVTGGAGYIGSHTVLELLNKDYYVVVVDNLSNSSYESLRRVQQITGKTVKFYEGDIRDREMLEKIFNENELTCRIEVELEKYTKKVQIESRILGDLAINHGLPAAKRSPKRRLDKVANVKMVFDAEEAKVLNEQDCLLIRRIEAHASAIIAGVDKMTQLRVTANHIDNQRERALAFHDTVVPIMEEIRKHVDELEMWVDDQLWTLPKYRELLFVH